MQNFIQKELLRNHYLQLRRKYSQEEITDLSKQIASEMIEYKAKFEY